MQPTLASQVRSRSHGPQRLWLVRSVELRLAVVCCLTCAALGRNCFAVVVESGCLWLDHFADPFPPSTTTLDNPAYRWFSLSLMKGASTPQRTPGTSSSQPCHAGGELALLF